MALLSSFPTPAQLHVALNVVANWCGAPAVLRPNRQGYIKSLQELRRQLGRKTTEEQNRLRTATSLRTADAPGIDRVEVRTAGRDPSDGKDAIWVEVGAAILREEIAAGHREEMAELAIWREAARWCLMRFGMGDAAGTIKTLANRVRVAHYQRSKRGKAPSRNMKNGIIERVAREYLSATLAREKLVALAASGARWQIGPVFTL